MVCFQAQRKATRADLAFRAKGENPAWRMSEEKSTHFTVLCIAWDLKEEECRKAVFG